MQIKMSFNCLPIVIQLISIVTLINAVPIVNVTDAGVQNLTSVPDPVNINGSLTVLDTTEGSIDLMTTISSISSSSTSPPPANTSVANESRDGRSGEELIIPNQEAIKNDTKESDKASAIRFPREDEIDSVMINSTSSKSSVDQVATISPVADTLLESNSTLIEGLIESSSTSSVSSSTTTVVDLSSPPPSPSPSPSASPPTSTSTSTSTSKPSATDQIIINSTSSVAPRMSRSQSDTIDDEINSNLNDTLLILTTLSSILNQSTTNDSISSI